MLHWTGGSRRKVTTSRKSTENRQRQYFEQKRRRQQTAHPQNFDSGPFRYVQQPKERRSLDIQSLLNLSTITAKRESAPTDGDACLKVPAGKPTNANILIDPVEHQGPGSSQNNAETVSPRRGVNNASNNQGKGSSDKMDHWNVFSEPNVSVLDLLDNEGIDQDSDFNQVNEDHVAFSIDGKTGKKTGDHLQWCPDRHFSYGFASPSKNTGYLDLSRNTSRAPYEPRHDTGSIGKDFNEAFSPTPRALGSTFCRGNASSIPNQDTVGLWDDVEYNLGHSSKNASGRKNSFSDIYDSNADLWDAKTSIGENFFCERDFDVSRKHLGVDTTYNNNIQYGYTGVHASDNVHLPKKRASSMAGFGVNISEPHTQNYRQRTSGDGWCGNLMDDPSDGLSSVSEESCSSTYNSVLNTNSKHTRDKHSISFGRTGNTMHQSREHDRMLGQSNSNPFHRSSMNLQEKFSSDKNWSTGKGYNPFNTDSDFNSFYNPEGSHFDLTKETPLTVFPEPDSRLDGQFCFDPSNNYKSFKVSPSSSSIDTHAPHRTFKEMDSDSFTDFCKVESRIDDQPPSFFEEISLKESGDGNENCAVFEINNCAMFEIRCFQEIHFNGKPCRASNCNWTPSESMNDLTCKDSNELKDGISDVESNARPSGCNNVEASSSTVLESNKKHEDTIHDDAAETRVAILSERVETKVVSRRKEDYINSANKVTMLRSSVFQLLCVQYRESHRGPHVAV